MHQPDSHRRAESPQTTGPNVTTQAGGLIAKAIQSPSCLRALPVSVSVFHLTVSAPHIVLALPFAEQVRRALIRNRVNTSHSEAITGKHKDGTPLDGHEHAHYFATDEDHDGRIDHITIFAPRGFDDADLEALGSLRTIFRSGNRPEVRMVLTGLGGQDLLSEVSIFAEARNWRSVTPFSLPRFPNRGGGKPPRPRDLPEAQLIRELKNRGLPEPVSIKRIEGYQVEGRPPVRWLEFHTTRYNGTKGNGLAGFEIEFAEPVRGPIAVGFACHFGLGLFAPVVS
jgi:CRISPR-associated protein Csb2